MEQFSIPIYRAKKIDSDEYVIGNYIKTQNKYYIYEDGTSDIYIDDEECFEDGSIDGEIRIIDLLFEIDPATLAIHFPSMLNMSGTEIFASLNNDGMGGSLVISKCYPFYGDAPEITESSGKCEELNYIGVITTDGISTFIEYIKVSDRVRGGAIGYQIDIIDLKNFEVIGIQE